MLGEVTVRGSRPTTYVNSKTRIEMEQTGNTLKHKRDAAMDILKGIGIILMVVGHSECPELLGNLIYLFHMPLFFLASGYFLSLKSFDNRTFLHNKVRTLYVPFVKWALVFLFLHNLFYNFGIINGTYGAGDGTVSSYLTLSAIFKRIVLIFLFMDVRGEFLLGAYWFMRALFVGYVMLFALMRTLNHISHDSKRNLMISCAVFASLGCLISIIQTCMKGLPYIGYREVMGAFFIGSGFFIKEHICMIHKRKVCPILALAIIACLFIYHAQLRAKPSFYDWAVIIFSAPSGFLLTYRLSICINRTNGYIKKALIYTGQRTFYILTFHFLMFKPISYLKIQLCGLNQDMIGYHPVILDNDAIWWIPYTVGSIVLCLSVTFLLEKTKIIKV